MEKIVIDGGNALHGRIEVSGMKNAGVPIIFACVAVGDVCIIENLPNISDVVTSLEILLSIGVRVRYLAENSVEIDARNVSPASAPCALVKKMRGSYYLIGAMLGRDGGTSGRLRPRRAPDRSAYQGF